MLLKVTSAELVCCLEKFVYEMKKAGSSEYDEATGTADQTGAGWEQQTGRIRGGPVKQSQKACPMYSGLFTLLLLPLHGEIKYLVKVVERAEKLLVPELLLIKALKTSLESWKSSVNVDLVNLLCCGHYFLGNQSFPVCLLGQRVTILQTQSNCLAPLLFTKEINSLYYYGCWCYHLYNLWP